MIEGRFTGREINMEMATGLSRASRLGTSSPKIRVMKLIKTTTQLKKF